MEYLGDKMRHGGDDGSTYVAEMFALCGGVNVMDDGYQDRMLSRTTMISGGGGCKASKLQCDRRWARSCTQARAGAWARAE